MRKNSYHVSVMAGDGIGPEVTAAAVTVLNTAAALNGFHLSYTWFDHGAETYRRTGNMITDEEMATVGQADAILFGAMGLPDVRQPDGREAAPQHELRTYFDFYVSLRPIKLFKGVNGPLKTGEIDLLVIRETTEGLFAGIKDEVEPSNDEASDRMTITRKGCERLFQMAFTQARQRKSTWGTPGKVTLLDKANALRSNVLMRKVFHEIAAHHPDIIAEANYVDAGTMFLVTNPERYDVVVTENMFGDIASEVAAGTVGGIGMAPSAEIGPSQALFQPCHGSAPDIAGRGLANPIGMILSAAMLLDWLALRHHDSRCAQGAVSIREATESALAGGVSTPDIGGDASTEQVTSAICQHLSSANVPA